MSATWLATRGRGGLLLGLQEVQSHCANIAYRVQSTILDHILVNMSTQLVGNTVTRRLSLRRRRELSSS